MTTLTSQLLVRLVDGVSGPARKASAALAGIGNVARGISGMQARLGAAIEKNNTAMAAARGKMFDAVAAGYGLKRALTAPISAAAKFETALEDIGQKGEIPRTKLGELGNQIRQIARQTNQAAPQIAKAMDTLVGFGLDPTASAKLLQPIGRAATAYRADVDDLAKAGYAALANLKVPAEDFSKALDAMAKAGKEGAFELKDQARYMPALGAAYQALGQKGVPAVADLSAALQAVRKGAGTSEEAATNLQNVLQKMTFPETRKKFAKFGVDIRKELAKAAKEGKTPIEALAEITNRTVKGDLSMIGDLFQDAEAQKGLRALIQNLDEYRQIRAKANSANGIVEDDFARRLETAQGSLDRITNAIENLNNSIGVSLLPTVSALSGKIASMMDRFSAFADAYPKLTSAIVSTAAAVVGLNVALAAMRFAGLFMKGGLLSVASAALVAASGMRKLLVSMAGFAVAPVIAAFRGLRTAMIGFAAASAIAGSGTALRILGTSLLGLLNPIALVRGAFVALRFALLATGIGAAIAAIAAAGLWIYNNWSGIKELFAGIADGFAKGLGPAAEYLKPVADLAKQVWDAVSGILGPLDASNEKWRAWGETIGRTVASGVNAVADGISRIIGFFSTAIEKAYSFGRAVKSALGFGGGASPAVAPAAAPAPAVAGKRAAGGPIFGGRSYLVGEEGPELVTPTRSGYVHPNGSGGGGVTLHQTVSLAFSGITDTSEIIRKAGDALADATREAIRGLQADVGFKFS